MEYYFQCISSRSVYVSLCMCVCMYIYVCCMYTRVLYIHKWVVYTHGVSVPRSRGRHWVSLVPYFIETRPLIETGASLEVRKPQRFSYISHIGVIGMCSRLFMWMWNPNSGLHAWVASVFYPLRLPASQPWLSKSLQCFPDVVIAISEQMIKLQSEKWFFQVQVANHWQ